MKATEIAPEPLNVYAVNPVLVIESNVINPAEDDTTFAVTFGAVTNGLEKVTASVPALVVPEPYRIVLFAPVGPLFPKGLVPTYGRTRREPIQPNLLKEFIIALVVANQFMPSYEYPAGIVFPSTVLEVAIHIEPFQAIPSTRTPGNMVFPFVEAVQLIPS